MQNTHALTAPSQKSPLVKIVYSIYHWLNHIKIYWLFIILFAYTGANKLWWDGGLFRFNVWRAETLRPYYITISYAVPIAELVTAALLTVNFPIKIGRLKTTSRMVGLWASLVLMVAFTAYVGGSLAFKKGLPCTCGGIISQMTWTQHLIFNAAFSLLAVRAIILQRKSNYT